MDDMQMCGLTGCGGQRPSSTVCSSRSLRLVWILVRSVCEGQGAGDTLSRPTFTWRLCMPRGPFWKQHRHRDFLFFFSNTSNTRGYRLSGQRGAEYLVLHALLDAPVVPFQFCILWKWVSLPADWHATFNRRHHCLRTHTQNKWVDAQ